MFEAGEGEGTLGSSTVQMLVGGKLWVASTGGAVWGCTQALGQCSPHPPGTGGDLGPCWPPGKRFCPTWAGDPCLTGNVCSELHLCFAVTWLQQLGG